MSIKKLSIEFGPEHVISRAEFVAGPSATVVGVESQDEVIWSVDCEDVQYGEMAKAVTQRAFFAAMEAIVGDGEQGQEETNGR